MSHFLAAAALAAGNAALARAQAPVMTIEQTMSAERLVGGRISPDGRSVLYGVSRVDWQANRFVTELWIASAATGERNRLTAANKWDGASRWSPDGRLVAFLSDRGGANQIYLIRPSGGEAVRLTDVEAGVNAFRWSPDGRRIAYLTSDLEPEAAKAERERTGGIQVLESGRDSASDIGRSHLWLMNLPGSAPTATASAAERLTGGTDFTINEFEWSPDGRRIAFSAVLDASPRGRATSDIYLVELAGRRVTKLVDTPGPDTYPIWSPDGGRIAYETSNGSLTYFETNRYVATVPAAGGNPRLLTGRIDEQASLLAWGPEAIYMALEEGTDLNLYRLDPDTSEVSRIRSLDSYAHQQWTFSADYRHVAFVGAGASTWPELYVASLRHSRPRRLTNFDG